MSFALRVLAQGIQKSTVRKIESMLQKFLLITVNLINTVITGWRGAVCAGACVALSSMGLQAMQEVYSPYADRDFPTALLFGETHVHSALSADAGGGGTS